MTIGVIQARSQVGITELFNKQDGAFFSMNAALGGVVERAFFISPIVDMEKLICAMMNWANVNEAELKEKGTIRTLVGEDLSWEYLAYVRNNPIRWSFPTAILYGGRDNLISLDTIRSFAKTHGAVSERVQGEQTA